MEGQEKWNDKVGKEEEKEEEEEMFSICAFVCNYNQKQGRETLK